MAATPREAAAGKQVIISMLADDAASRAIWLGPDGALAGAMRGAVAVECSTVTVPWVRELAAAAAERGVEFLDAPVTGTKPHAANGELTFLVGGSAETREKVRPLLVMMSKEIIHLGPMGSGAAAEADQQFYVRRSGGGGWRRDWRWCRARGWMPRRRLPLLVNGAPGSPLVKILATRHGNKDYTPNFQLRLLAKDMAYAIDEGKAKGLNLATAQAALATMKQAIAAGFGEQDMSSIIRFLQDSK